MSSRLPTIYLRMSLKRISPSASLLRTSRLFAVPHTLPKPTSESAALTTYGSDTATLPYPAHAAIETSESALGRGDWGLKRPLPLKSTTRTSNPHIHIENIDSIDHITDFGSAASHTRTLEKWHETNLSISQSRQNEKEALQSVFESTYDNTATGNSSTDQERWRFEGPWLGGQTHGEFSEYLAKTIRKRRPQFRQYLRRMLMRQKHARLRREATESDDEIGCVLYRTISAFQAPIQFIQEMIECSNHLLHRHCPYSVQAGHQAIQEL